MHFSRMGSMEVVNADSINTNLEAMLRENTDLSPAVASLQLLLEFIENDDYTTIQGMEDNLQKVIRGICTAKCSITCVRSACELFVRFATRTALDCSIDECKKKMSTRGRTFLEKMRAARSKIATLAAPFVQDRSTILTHSFSRVVRDTLFAAAEDHKHFTVYVTESAPDYSGRQLYEALEERGISVTVILDSAVGYILEKVDVVLLGAEGVVESGGIINKIGTYTMAMCAKEKNIPIYVLAESFKFARKYPLNQKDLPDEQKYPSDRRNGNTDLSKEHPMIDYTPPAYITLLFTDLGILTPSAVSDELINLYV
ncbi:translation initiation factor eIF-2B subunit alpha [Rhipicephalus sanguineus]|uniref:translation initiation factor eIF-2B subunit alpha n=1 Tax=Rhipicephalus sanguineus TaxID=34632 RepID=UPI001894DBB4|nr:translation initiation factor eIF-2B subunit alpha [Rhipicephalus sanguineus]